MAPKFAALIFAALYFDGQGRSFAQRDIKLVTCQFFRAIPNAVIHYNSLNYTLGSFAYLLCYDGYEPKGNTATRCSYDGTWRPLLGTCKLKPKKKYCRPYVHNKIPVLIYEPSIIQQAMPLNTRVTLICPPGKTIRGNPTSICVDGDWEPELGYCVEIAVEEVEEEIDQTDLVNGH